MINKRAQAALEFMTTYGWALMVTAIALGGLSYLVSTDAFIGDACYTGNAPLSCTDYALSLDTLNLKMKNNVGREITQIAVSCEYDGNTGTGTAAVPLTVLPGSNFEISCTNIPGLTVTKKAKVTFSLIYRETDRLFNSSADGYVVLLPG